MSRQNRQHVETVLVFFSMGILLALASGTFGLTWDESIYFRFSDSIRSWFLQEQPFHPDAIASYWSYSDYHNPHPPFMKIMGAVSSHWFTGVLPYPTGYRLANLIYVSACLAVAYRLLAPAFSSAAALAAVGFVAFQPRVFGHLLIAATDSPVAMSWLVLTLIVWKLRQNLSLRKRIFLRILLFFFLACASATKITGFLAIVPLAVYLLANRQRREFLWLAGAGIFALVFVVAVWPPQWAQPLRGMAQYLLYPLTRSEMSISACYLGKIYKFYLPWHYFSVMTAVTFPAILLFCLGGLVFIKRLNHHGLLWALLCPVLFWLIIVHLPATPRHDGVRQFISLYPLLGLLAWLGLLALLARWKIASLWPGRLHADQGLSALVVIILFFQTATIHPYELSFYNKLIGGIKGAEKKGLEMTYYLEAANQPFMRHINSYLDRGAVVDTYPPWPLLLESYARHGLLTGNFSSPPTTSASSPRYRLIFRRRGYVEDSRYKSIKPLAEVTCQGVSLVKFIRVRIRSITSSGSDAEKRQD